MSSEVRLTGTPRSEAVLSVSESYDMFKNFAWYTGEGDWSIV